MGLEQVMEVYFSVEGGFANRIRSVKIGDGSVAEVVVGGRASATDVEPEVVEAIIDALDRSRLFDRDRCYEPEPGADLQRYEIRYAGATVVAFDTTVPDELTEAITLLEAVLLRS